MKSNLELSENESELSKLGAALNLSESDIERIVARQQEKNILFGEAAKELGLVTEKELQKGLSDQFGFSYANASATKLSAALVTAHKPFSVEAEKIRSLRSQLLIRYLNDEQKVLAVTSVSQEDNASTLAANLAIVFSQLNKKTLLIDANLRQPAQHKLFGIETKLGLTNILANRKGQYSLSPQKSLPNLTILSAGTAAPNPQELLSTEGLSSLLSDLEKIYDVILVDTSPANLGMDYLAVVAKVKAALFVARKGLTRIEELSLLKSQVQTTSATIVGSVIQ